MIKRRSQGAIRRLRYPSITIWPASVPVKVELWPAHNKATPNKIGAALPRNVGSSMWASSMLVTSMPRRPNTAALTIRIAALTKNATLSAMAASSR